MHHGVMLDVGSQRNDETFFMPTYR